MEIEEQGAPQTNRFSAVIEKIERLYMVWVCCFLRLLLNALYKNELVSTINSYHRCTCKYSIKFFELLSMLGIMGL